jgi:hypothetical protein
MVGLAPQIPNTTPSLPDTTISSSSASSAPLIDNDALFKFHHLQVTTPSFMETVQAVNDTRWSLLSNVFFLAGGLCYVIATVWDIVLHGDTVSENNHIYNSLWVLGPLVYLMNSCIDVAWALKLRKREQTRRHLRDLLMQETFSLEQSTMCSEEIQDAKCGIMLRLNRMLHRLRRHMGHRRELGAALTFGIAAAFGLIAALLPVDGRLNPDAIDAISIHMYVVSAAFAICRRPASSSGITETTEVSVGAISYWDDADALESMGDVLFGVASIVDVVLCDFHFDDEVVIWPALSSILWLTDALLYLRADFIVFYFHNSNDSYNEWQ